MSKLRKGFSMINECCGQSISDCTCVVEEENDWLAIEIAYLEELRAESMSDEDEGVVKKSDEPVAEPFVVEFKERHTVRATHNWCGCCDAPEARFSVDVYVEVFLDQQGAIRLSTHYVSINDDE